jgi:hypothetical protein
MEAGFIGSLKVAVIALLVDTFTAPLAGSVVATGWTNIYKPLFLHYLFTA